MHMGCAFLEKSLIFEHPLDRSVEVTFQSPQFVPYRPKSFYVKRYAQVLWIPGQ